MSIVIFGAGLSGLIAATQFPSSTIFEASEENRDSHKALLRFRTENLSRLTGIPFRKVNVRKSIWFDGRHEAPNIRLANMYSIKTNGSYLDRSIWNTEPCERFIAPEDLQAQLIEQVGRRINWASPVLKEELADIETPIISTMPMPTLMSLLGMPLPGEFKHQPITVDRMRVHNANVHQTIYFPDKDQPAYRASITGDLLIIERKGELSNSALSDLLEAFGIRQSDVSMSSAEFGHVQRFGKIQPILDTWRRQTIFNITREHNIYSLGRFAVWRNILLDDVVEDVAVIKRIISGGKYSAALQHHQKG